MGGLVDYGKESGLYVTSDGKALEGFGQQSKMIQHRAIPLVATGVAQARDSGDLVYSGSSGGEGVQYMWSESMVGKNHQQMDWT